MGILLIIKNEFIRLSKNKKKAIYSLLIPVFAVIVAIFLNVLMKPSISIGYIDNSNIGVGSEFKKDANKIKGLRVNEATLDSLNTDMILGKYAAIAQFNENKHITVKCLDSHNGAVVNEIITNYIFSKDLSGFQTLLDNMSKEGFTAAQRGCGFILLILITTCTLSACNIIKDKNEGILKRYKMCCFEPYTYILGMYAYNLLFAGIQVLISTLVLTFMPINLGITSLEFFLIGLIISIISSSFACLFSNLSESELQASIGASSIAMIMSLIGGAFLPFEKMPHGLKIISNGTVTRWVIELTKSMENGYKLINILIPILVIVSLCIVLVFISTMVGKKKFV
ncbi:ABC transporter permease [Clostridium tagluense]|uniref:ABC transporter permease n=1 Tax=Clostridium tagluense TaxID=360422 RepID=UPI001CF350B8|nr:ABC transporter permease [Clostridium tagluense]MCB2296233.1 ABC transporter permease [Clostridium tagluense]